MKNCTGHILIQLFLGIALCSAQNFRYTYYKHSDLPFKKVSQINQDAQGYMWIASDKGLFRFDGTQFEDFNLTLKSRNIKSLLSTHRDTLYFSNDEGLFRLTYQEGLPKINKWVETSEAETLMGYPEELFRDSKGRFWVSQLDGSVFSIDASGKLQRKFQLSNHPKTGKITFGEDKNNTIWAMIPDEGLFYLNENQKKFTLFQTFPSCQHFAANGAKLIVVGNDIKIFTLDDKKNVKREKVINSDEIRFNQISKDLEGNYFLSADKGLFSLDIDKGIFQKVFGSNDPHRVEELPFISFDHLYFAPSELRKGGDIWVSTQQGFGILQFPFFQSVSGLPHDNVLSINTHSKNKVLLAMGNLFQLEKANPSFSFDKNLELSRISSISTFNDMTWYGTSDGSILFFKNGSQQRVYNLSEVGGGIFFMSTDHVGETWFCQAPLDKPILGVKKVSSTGTIVDYGVRKGINSRILVIKEGGRSEIYAAGIGADSYLFKYDRENDTFQDKSLPFKFEVGSNFEVHDLTIDHQGVVWLATTDGLLKYDTETINRVNLGPFTTQEIRSITSSKDGNLWLATDTNGLIFYGKNKSYVQFDESSGTPSKVSTYRNLSIDQNEFLWFGTAEGVVYSSVANAGPLRTKSPIIKSILVNDKNVEQNEMLNVHEKSRVELHVSTTAFPGKEVLYQYKIIDDEHLKIGSDHASWSDPVSSSKISLPEIKSGEYTLKIRGQQKGGHMWSAPSILNLTIKPMWYSTWWGVLILSIGGILLFWITTRQWGRFKTRNLRKLLLEEQLILAKKEALLVKKDSALRLQQEELKSTGANVYMLNRLLSSLPQSGTWPEIFKGLKRLVELPTGIDAFEIARVEGGEIRYQGFYRNKTGHIRRKEEFNEKENFASYVATTGKPLILDNVSKQALNYLCNVPENGFSSHLLVPFQQQGNTAVFCVYGTEEKKFSQRDLSLIQILTNFLGLITSKPMKEDA
nr:GAF domain-containing protein [uncultured Allomuricauda sp.]